MENNYDELILQAETAREQDKYAEALLALDQAIIICGYERDFVKLINTMAHKLIIYKNLFQKTGSEIFNELMFGVAQSGFSITERYGITGQPRAVMIMRLADYYFWTKNFARATALYKEAVTNADRAKPGEYSEYLSHLGLSEVFSDEPDGIKRLLESLDLAKIDTLLRPFHKIVVECGINMRLAVAYNKLGNKDESKKYYSQALKQAKELKEKYGMGMRLIQLESVKQELGI